MKAQVSIYTEILEKDIANQTRSIRVTLPAHTLFSREADALRGWRLSYPAYFGWKQNMPATICKFVACRDS